MPKEEWVWICCRRPAGEWHGGVRGAKVLHSLFAIVAPFICLLSAVMLFCWCLLLLLGPSSSFRVIAFVCFLQDSLPFSLFQQDMRLAFAGTSCVYFLFIYFVRGTKAGNVESEAQRTRMSRSNPLTHFPVRHSLKVKIYCILLLFFYWQYVTRTAG